MLLPKKKLKTVTVESLIIQNQNLTSVHYGSAGSLHHKSSIDCEVDTRASCNIQPLYKPKALFGEDLKLGKPTVNLKGHNDSPVGNLGFCFVYLYHGNKMYRVLSEVDDSKSHMILGRKQASVMEYVSFPEIQKPVVQAPVVQKLDNAIWRINRYPVDK